MIYPGSRALAIIDNPNPELTVKVEGVSGLAHQLPDQKIERRIRSSCLLTARYAEITSLDVLHSFWVPAFQMKIDAVPGKTTLITLKPTNGSYETDDMFRPVHRVVWDVALKNDDPVSVVSEDDFQKWVSEESYATPAPADGSARRRDLRGAATQRRNGASSPRFEVQRLRWRRRPARRSTSSSRTRTAGRYTMYQSIRTIPRRSLYTRVDSSRAGHRPSMCLRWTPGRATSAATFTPRR